MRSYNLKKGENFPHKNESSQNPVFLFFYFPILCNTFFVSKPFGQSENVKVYLYFQITGLQS